MATTTAPAPPSRFEPGDHVYIGEPTPGKVHWVVEHIHHGLYAQLRSGQSERRRFMEPLVNLVLHSKGTTTS